MNYWRRLVGAVHHLQDLAGLPVNYTGAEFREFKHQVDPSRMEEDRIELLSVLFGLDAREIQRFVDEAGQVNLPTQHPGGPEFRPLGGGMSREDRTTLYAVVRAAKPEVVIETGTADGVSATFILAAFERNQRGFLYTVDAGDDQARIGQLIPASCRDRVKLLYGDSLSVFRGTLKDVKPDLFLHDSNHKYAHMTAEFNWAFQNMPEGGIICSHDVLFSNAWKHFLSARKLENNGVIMNLGVCRVEPSQPARSS